MVRNSASGTYYARFRVSGKLVWRSLETKAFTTAKTKLPDLIKAEKQLIAAGDVELTRFDGHLGGGALNRKRP